MVSAPSSGFQLPRPGQSSCLSEEAPQSEGSAHEDAGRLAEKEQRPADAATALDGGALDVSALKAELGIDRVLGALDAELVGLAPVKARIRDVASLLLVDRMRRAVGLATARPNLHMCFSGPPGTGKTTVATRMAEILHGLGYLPTSRLVVVSREDLVGQYVGHTAPKTKDVLTRAMGGVLFIDEAYSLHRPENERDYGQEAIEMLLQVMEEQRERLVVILAGYEDRMEAFFAMNPGLRSRIAHHLEFTDFSLDELVEIGQRMMAEQGYALTPESAEVFREYLARRHRLPHFANARSVRNAIDRARLRQATRLVHQGGSIMPDDLRLLLPEDLLASRVFAQTLGEPAGEG
jgi:probable Rubsico expression protein CbbX